MGREVEQQKAWRSRNQETLEVGHACMADPSVCDTSLAVLVAAVDKVAEGTLVREDHDCWSAIAVRAAVRIAMENVAVPIYCSERKVVIATRND